MSSLAGSVLLGTVAIEPSRWAAFLGNGEAAPPEAVSVWLDQVGAAGFDGVEVWERHLTDAAPTEVDAVLEHAVPISVFNSYVSFDDHDSTARAEAAAWATRAGARGVKFNVGNDPKSESAYSERIGEWVDALDPSVALLCECHHGISIAEDPQVAARIFDAAGPTERVQAIVHTHEAPDDIRSRFDAYGDRITHIHVNFLDFETMSAPRLADISDRVETQVELLRALGFAGSWTIEFTHGVLTENDRPDFLLARAIEDLAVLRELLA